MERSMAGRVFRLNASSRSRADDCRSRCIITVPNTGSWSAVPLASQSATRSRQFTKMNRPYIPIRAKRRLENPGRIDLELQTGGYLGEDDIVRIEDIIDGGEVFVSSVLILSVISIY